VTRERQAGENNKKTDLTRGRNLKEHSMKVFVVNLEKIK